MHATHRDLEASENDELRSRKVDEYAHTHEFSAVLWIQNTETEERFTD